jgi:hypothetical protein
MDEVIQHPGAEDVLACVVDPGLVTSGHFPVVIPSGWIKARENLLCLRRFGVELLQDFRPEWP